MTTKSVMCRICREVFRPRADGKIRAHRRRVKGPRGGRLLKERKHDNGDYCAGGPLPAWKATT